MKNKVKQSNCLEKMSSTRLTETNANPSTELSNVYCIIHHINLRNHLFTYNFMYIYVIFIQKYRNTQNAKSYANRR